MTADSAPDGASVNEGPVLLFDGVCTLCTGVVRFLIPRDSAGRLSFAPLQSPAGQRLLERHDRDGAALDSVVLLEGGQLFTKSAAVIRVAELLGWPYRLATVGRLVPAGLRDRLYDVVAANRYDWFGSKDQCLVPEEEVSDRFLDETE